MTLPSGRPVYPLRPVEVSRVGDLVTFGCTEGWHGAREVQYRGWNRPAPKDDPAGRISENDLRLLVEGWTGGFRSSDHLRLAVAAACAGRPVPEGKPVPGCGCSGCTGIPAPPPLPRQPLPNYREALDVDRARTVPVLAVARALGIEGLRRAGRTHRAPCPLHHGDGPNFAVGETFFKCHACGESGDAIRLVRLMRGSSFPEAVQFVLSAA